MLPKTISLDVIAKLYEKWCNLERLKYKTYTQKEKKLPQLVDNKVFQPVRNMIIKAVIDMNNPAAAIEVNPHESIEQYAQNVFDNTEKFENEMLTNTIFSLFVNISSCIEDDYHNKLQSGRKMLDSKLRRMIQEKNQS